MKSTLLLLSLQHLLPQVDAFASRSLFILTPTKSNPSAIYAKKKSSSTKKGFAKKEDSIKNVVEETTVAAPTPSPPFLESIPGGSDAIPNEEVLPPEERTKQILREKYGMQTMAEQQLSAKQLEQRKEQQRKLKEWKEKADAGEDFDILTALPAPLLFGIDRFLKIGVAVTGILFIAAGLGITLEAWSKTSGQALPPDVDGFIANIVEPNFTTGLFVLLGFSISLGLFSAAQLGSAGARYREDD